MTLIGYTMMGEQAGPKQLVREVALAEQAGFDFAVISDHYFPKVPQHRARRMAVPAGLGATRPPAQRGRQPEPVGQLHQQRRPSMPGDSIAVAGDLEPRRRLGSLHPQGALLSQGM
jgi:alkanesulfonate monooxygenase SsuD/methylene tetrahydromethanopterin reductase-like flavin-dependent oxidoreductase (luciferase family)